MSTSDAASGSNPESIRAEGRRGGKNSKAEAQVMIGWISIDRLGVKRLKVLEWRTESKRTTHSSRQGLKVYEHDPNEFEILRCYWPYGTRSSDDTNSESSSSSGSSESETGYDSTRRPVRSIASYYDELDRRSRTPAPTRTRTLPPLNIPDPPPRRAPIVPPPLPESILRRPTSDAPHRSSRSHRDRHTSSGSTRADKAFQVTIVTAVMMLAIACAAFRLHSLRPISAMRDIPQNRFSTSTSPAAVDPWEKYTSSSTPHLSAQSSQTQSRFQPPQGVTPEQTVPQPRAEHRQPVSYWQYQPVAQPHPYSLLPPRAVLGPQHVDNVRPRCFESRGEVWCSIVV